MLDDLSLQIHAGDLIAILGLNGAGKTTILRTLAGLLGRDQGRVLVGEKELDRFEAAARREFIFVPDFPVFFDELTVKANIGIWLKTYQKTETVAQVCDLLESFDLAESMHKFIIELSRGQRFKVALAILATIDPPVWLLDEPFASGMDPAGLRLFRELAQAAVERGRAVVYTTQLSELALNFASQILVLNEGKFRFQGHPDALRQQFSDDPFLAKFRSDES